MTSAKKSLAKTKKSAPTEPAQESATTTPEPSEATQSSEPGSEETEPQGGASGGAYDPVTGEINWDCPCLGGMAHGPCGEEFKAAFSCFVYSEEEPKGIDCVEKFKAMQNCFREHPDVYGEGACLRVVPMRHSDDVLYP